MRHHLRAVLPSTAVMLAILLAGCGGVATLPPSQARVATPIRPTAAVTAAEPSSMAPAAATFTATASTPPAPTPTEEPSRFDSIVIPAPSLGANHLGDPAERPIRIYLPPSYFTASTRYPVVYYLPGYSDSSMLRFSLPADADELMRSTGVREMIIVVASGVNRLGGSFYVNSPVTGNWEDFIVQDVVGYVDSHYHTIPSAASRGIAGHSMGGFGALNIAMRHPDIFSAVYSLSPGLFDQNGLAESQMFADTSLIKAYVAFEAKLAALPATDAQRMMLVGPDRFTLAYAYAFAPDLAKQPPYMDYPYTEVNGALVRDETIWKRWDAGFGGIPEEIDRYRANLLRLNGMVVDYGRQDEYA